MGINFDNTIFNFEDLAYFSLIILKEFKSTYILRKKPLLSE